jgi:hypothetical protein
MIKIGQFECTNIKWGSSCSKLWQTFEGLTKINLMKHHPCNKASWYVCVCVTYPMLNFQKIQGAYELDPMVSTNESW